MKVVARVLRGMFWMRMEWWEKGVVLRVRVGPTVGVEEAAAVRHLFLIGIGSW